MDSDGDSDANGDDLIILDSAPAGIVFRDSTPTTRDRRLRSHHPGVKTETSATPIIAYTRHDPAWLAMLAGRAAPAGDALKYQMRQYLQEVRGCDKVTESLWVDFSKPAIYVRCAKNIARFRAYPNLYRFRDGSRRYKNYVTAGGTCFQFPEPKVAVLRRLAP